MLIAVLSGIGCIPIPGKSGTTHHLVLGFGVVSVNEPENQASVVTDANVLGMVVSDRPGLKLGLGLSRSRVVTVADGAEDVRIEISSLPGGPLIVDCPSARLRKE